MHLSPRYVAGLKAQAEQSPSKIEKLKVALVKSRQEAGKTGEAKKAYDKGTAGAGQGEEGHRLWRDPGTRPHYEQ